MRFPRSDRWAICDVCGFKFHVKDVYKITDKYNRHYGLVVCKKDKDKTNQQDIPYKYKETIVTNIEKIRPRPSPVYTVNPNDNRAPSAPQNGVALLEPLTNTISLYWDGPSNTGSSGIVGYAIQVSSPQFTSYVYLSTNTYNPAPTYNDTVTSLSSYVGYKVAAINSFGVGPYSAEFYWPTLNLVAQQYTYIGVNGGATVLATSSGVPIILSPEV